MEYSKEEELVLQRFPGVSIHQIDKNRIGFSFGQSKMIFSLKDKVFDYLFLELCEEKLKKNGRRGLDSFELSRIIDDAKKQNQLIKLRKSRKEVTKSKRRKR